MFHQYCCLINTAQADEKLADKCTLCYAALDHGGTDLDRICIAKMYQDLTGVHVSVM